MKTTRELRDSGEFYIPTADKRLTEEYLHAADLLNELNSISLSKIEERRDILHRLLGEMGKQCCIVSPFHCDFGYNIHIGDSFFANAGFVVIDTARVSIGDNVYIGPQVGIYTATHALNPALRRQGYERALPVSLGNDVWVGGNACIMPGVSVGEGSVIGAGSVVTHDVPPFVVAAGNPCRVLRQIKPDDASERAGTAAD